MKNTIYSIVAVLVLVAASFAQSPTPAPAPVSLTNIYAAGVAYNNQGTPSIAGSALYAHSVNTSGTYAFTVVDAIPNTLKPFTVTTNFSAGVAQKVFTIGKVPIFVPTDAGVSFSGTSTGWNWSTGGMASIKLKGNWRLLPSARFLKSNVSNGSGVQPIVGIMVGWGN